MNMSLFSALARASASSSRSCHKTGVSAWLRTYGLRLSPARFLIGALFVEEAASKPFSSVVLSVLGDAEAAPLACCCSCAAII